MALNWPTPTPANDDAQQLFAIQKVLVDQKMTSCSSTPPTRRHVQPGIELANRARIPVITVDRNR